jgi:hypothetical protein
VAKPLQSDKDVVMEAVKKNGYNIKYSSNTMKKDKEIALEAIKNYKYAVKYLDKDIKQDSVFIKHCVSEYKKYQIETGNYINEYKNRNFKKV